MRLLLVEELHDIAPPIDYSLVPLWVIFCGSFLALAVVGLIIWLIVRRTRRPSPAPSPRARALAQLEQITSQIERTNPYQFSIRASDILRGFVHEQFQLPSTRQTSVEFLGAVAGSSAFSEDEKSLLSEFLSRCDLIKFARYEATAEDSRRLLEEATRFVRGGHLEPA